MNFGQALKAFDGFDAEQTIYVRENGSINAESEVVIDFYSDDGEPPASAAGMKYLLEVSLARDAIRVWSEWRDGRIPSIEEQIDAVVYYAENDAFKPAEG